MSFFFFFFFNDTATTEIYTLSLHDALPILPYPVTFSSNRLSLLERGVAVAVAHVRGGGELGKRWHDDGRLLRKRDRKSTRLNSSHGYISYAVFCLKKKK